MFFPEYSITPKTLKNIATTEYNKAIIDNTTILQSWENQLKKEAELNTIYHALVNQGINLNLETVKKVLDGLAQSPIREINNLLETLKTIHEISINKEFEENHLRYIHQKLTQETLPKSKQGTYRSSRVQNRTNPEEILAQMVELFDWLNSLDAKEKHPVITSAILKAQLELISPFESLSSLASTKGSYLVLKSSGYSLKDYLSLNEYLNNTKTEQDEILEDLVKSDMDFTKWIEYFTQGLATISSNIKEKVKLLAKDTQVAKATGRAKVSTRQEKIIQYLQDYGQMQNKDFGKLFPSKSEDTVLRDLKKLIDKGIVVKKGSTKASRYELK